MFSFWNKREKLQEFEYLKNDANWVIMYSLSWAFDPNLIESFFQEVNQDIEKFGKIAFNFENFKYCNSHFIWQLFWIAENLDKTNWKACIIKCNPEIYEMLFVVGIFELIPLFWNEHFALSYLTK